MNANWPNIKPLDQFRPYDFLSRDFSRPLTDLKQWQRETAKLPYRARERFIHQRADSRVATSFTYIRRPTYYAAFNAGDIPSGVSQTRLGLGLVWNPTMGSVLQSQTGSNSAAWGTIVAGAKQVYEAAPLPVSFSVDGQKIKTAPGVRDLPDGILEVTYALGKNVTKTMRFEDDAIRVHVRHGGKFTELLPLLVGGERRVTVDAEQIVLETPRGVMKILFSDEATAQEVKRTWTEKSMSVRVVQLHAEEELSYELRFASPPSAEQD